MHVSRLFAYVSTNIMMSRSRIFPYVSANDINAYILYFRLIIYRPYKCTDPVYSYMNPYQTPNIETLVSTTLNTQNFNKIIPHKLVLNTVHRQNEGRSVSRFIASVFLVEFCLL